MNSVKIIPVYDCGVNNADLEATIRRINNDPVIEEWNNRKSIHFSRSTWCPSSKPLFHYENVSMTEEWHDVNTFDISVIGIIVTVILVLTLYVSTY